MPTKSASLVGVASSAGVPSPIWPSAATELQWTMRSAPGFGGGADHRHGAVDVGAHHFLRLRHPEPVIGGDMNDVSAPGGGAGKRGGIGQVADHDLRVDARPDCAGRWRPRQQPQRMAARASMRATAEPTNPVAPVIRVVMRRSIDDPDCAGKRATLPPGISRRLALRGLAQPLPGAPARAEAAAMKHLSYVLALLGLLIGVLLVAYFGVGNVVAAVSRIGWPEFALIVGWQTRAVRGPRHRLGHHHASPRPPPLLGADLGPHGARRRRQLPAVLPGRRLHLRRPRDHLAGRRVAHRDRLDRGRCHRGIPGPDRVHLHRPRDSDLASAGSSIAGPVEAGIGLAVLACFGFIWVQKGVGTIFARLGARIAGNWFQDAKERVEVLQAELGLIYGHTGRLALGFFVHLIGWMCTGVAGWIGYHALACRSTSTTRWRSRHC